MTITIPDYLEKGVLGRGGGASCFDLVSFHAIHRGKEKKGEIRKITPAPSTSTEEGKVIRGRGEKGCALRACDHSMRQGKEREKKDPILL